jgi:hypothetical protein
MRRPVSRSPFRQAVGVGLALLCAGAVLAAPGEQIRTERFDRDPGWEGHNNRSQVPAPRQVRQEFGYSRTAHAGRAPGEVGGFISPAALPAYYAKKIRTLSFDVPFAASGRLAVAAGDEKGVGNALFGFFNSKTLNEWRTPNTVAIRINGRGGGVFHTHLEYCTAKWRAGGDFYGIRDAQTGRKQLREFPERNVVYAWKMEYDPNGNAGGGTVTMTLNGEILPLNLDPGHKADGATFDRFGFLNVMKTADDGGTLWIDDLVINGERDSFENDPRWEGKGNHRAYSDTDVRPRFDFGYSPTAFAGGARGEMGGNLFRGDCRYPDRMACYGDRVGPLTLEKPLRASGKMCMKRGVTDSTVLIGFYHSRYSMESNPSQSSGWPQSFLGIAVEGPSREGFLVYPAYRTRGDQQEYGRSDTRPHIYPDGKPHTWSLSYDPAGNGRMVVELDGKRTTLDLPEGHRASGAEFDRFGLVTTWIDGNGQRIYLDDLSYTAAQ